jgi:hypothetical protein
MESIKNIFNKLLYPNDLAKKTLDAAINTKMYIDKMI